VSGVGLSPRFAVYIVGPVAAGKTSVLEYLRCFDTHEEWIGDNPKEMYLASDNIPDDIARMIDDWVYDQISLKNKKLKATLGGFVFIDRGPLDLFAFEKDPSAWPDKARRVLQHLDGEELVDGQVAFLTADGAVLEKRNWKRGRTPDL